MAHIRSFFFFFCFMRGFDESVMCLLLRLGFYFVGSWDWTWTWSWGPARCGGVCIVEVYHVCDRGRIHELVLEIFLEWEHV